MNPQRCRRWVFLLACASLLVIVWGLYLYPGSPIPLRIRLLSKSPDWEQRRNAATELATLRSPQAVDLLMGLSRDPNDFVRWEARRAISVIWNATPPEVLVLWLRQRPAIAAAAAEKLGRKGLTSAVEPLSAVLARRPSRWQNPDDYCALRSAAAGALGAIGDERAVEPLMAAAAHPIGISDQVSAVEALRVFKSPRSFDLLLGIALARPVRDPSTERLTELLGEGILHSARISAIVALVELNDPRAVEPLIGLLKDPLPEVCGTAAWALGRFRDPRAVPALKALAEKSIDPMANDTVKQCAVHSLLEIEQGDAAGQTPPPMWPLD